MPCAPERGILCKRRENSLYVAKDVFERTGCSSKMFDGMVILLPKLVKEPMKYPLTNRLFEACLLTLFHRLICKFFEN